MAVKTLSHEKMKDINKFMQEVELMKKFSHPNIVSLLGELAAILQHLSFYLCACAHVYQCGVSGYAGMLVSSLYA